MVILGIFALPAIAFALVGLDEIRKLRNH